MRTALVQLNSIVGDLSGNAELILDRAREAASDGANLIVFPELALSGYPPEDLILKDHFAADCAIQLERLRCELPHEATIVVGFPLAENGKKYNAAAVLSNGEIIGFYRKMCLPNYGVFDEQRIFYAGTEPFVFELEGARVAIHICEDSWNMDGVAVAALAGQKIDVLVNLSASPYHRGKLNERTRVLCKTAERLDATLLYCNLVGGQDELVFDGASMVLSPDGNCLARAAQFSEDMLYFDMPASRWGRLPACDGQARMPTPPSGASFQPAMGSAALKPVLSDLEEVYAALKLGLLDYIDKNGFKRVVVALSGGIDSALVLALAVDALGADRVAAVTMPSQFSSSDTLNDAIEMARLLGVEFYTVPIKGLYDGFTKELSAVWGSDKPPGLAEENLQARIRGNLIMALSNEFGWIVLTTGNKSEMAMGYCTIYGDMAGGFAVIKDVPKTLVFDLCRWRNERGGVVIPPRIITRPPSAELRADQKDTDSLPPYEVLDPILRDYVENDLGIESLIARGYDEAIVRRVVRSVEQSEYKRRQSPPGIKITPRSFGRDRRMPITNRYRKKC